MTINPAPARPLLLRGGHVLDVATGETSREDVAVRDGRVVPASEVADAEVVDAGGRTICFGLWDCHAHPGSRMYDPDARGYFEGAAEWAVRAGTNLMEAETMGVTGVLAPGPRLTCAAQAIRTTGAATAPPTRAGTFTSTPRRSVTGPSR